MILKQQQQEQQDQYVIEGRRGRQDANREWIKQHSGTLPSLEAARTRRDEMSEEKKKKKRPGLIPRTSLTGVRVRQGMDTGPGGWR